MENIQNVAHASQEKQEPYRRLLAELAFPEVSRIQTMEQATDLYVLWQNNEAVLQKLISTIPLQEFPHFAVHGSSKEGLTFLKEHSIPVSVAVNFKTPESPEEVLSILSSLVASGLNHSHRSIENGGGFVVVNLGKDSGTLRRLVTDKAVIAFSDLIPMKYGTIEDSPSEIATIESIRTMEARGDIAAGELFSPDVSQNAHIEVLYENLPQYFFVETEDAVMRSYVDQIARRLETQAAIGRVVEWLVESLRFSK